MGLDVAKIKRDFPILEREVHGKRLVYLDSASSSEKPTAVLDAMDDLYRTSYANVHRGVYTIADESTRAYEGARAKVAALHQRPRDRGDRLHPQRDRGDQPRRVHVGPREPRTRATWSCSARWSTTPTSCRG